MVVLCCGAALGAKLFDVGHSDLPSAISEKVLHTSLTAEESVSSPAPRVHLHAQFTFEKRIDRLFPAFS